MRFKQLDLNLLVALDRMMERQSITHAADEMNMSQSAMSNALTRLRHYFDDPLLVQVGRRMELTPKAEAMRHSVRDILVRVDSTISSDLVFEPANSTREFRILLSDYSMTTLMPNVLALADAQQSKVRFSLLPQMDFPYLAIERGEADLLIAPTMLVSQEHPSELVFEDRFVVVAWSQGKYGKGELTEDTYQEAAHIRMIPPRVTGSFESEFLERRGIARNTQVSCYSFASLPHLVVGTDRLATVHGLLAKKFADTLPIVIHEFPFPAPVFEQRIQWHEHKGQDPGLRWLIGLIHAAADRLVDPVTRIENLNAHDPFFQFQQ